MGPEGEKAEGPREGIKSEQRPPPFSRGLESRLRGSPQAQQPCEVVGTQTAADCRAEMEDQGYLQSQRRVISTWGWPTRPQSSRALGGGSFVDTRAQGIKWALGLMAGSHPNMSDNVRETENIPLTA